MAKRVIEKFVAEMSADDAKFRRTLARSSRDADKWGRDIRKGLGLGSILSGVAVGTLLGKVVSATKKQEQAVAQLEAGLASTGGVVGRSLEELQSKAEELQKVTTFGDEDIIQAQAQLLTFTNVTGEAFDKTIESALDLSARFGTDLKSSVLQLGKAMNDPVTQMSALSRSGVTFSKVQKDMVKSLVESGDLLGAQKVILKELETQFGGSAEAARDTFGGALEGLSGALGDLMEADGDGLSDAKEAVEGVTAALQDPATVSGADALVSSLLRLTTIPINFFSEFGSFGEQLAANAAAIGGNLSAYDELEQKIKDVDRALKGGFSTPLKFIGVDDAELNKLKESLAAQQKALSAGPSFIADNIAELRGLDKKIMETGEMLTKALAAEGRGVNQFGAIDAFKAQLNQFAERRDKLLSDAPTASFLDGLNNDAGGKPKADRPTEPSLLPPPGPTPAEIAAQEAAAKREAAALRAIQSRGASITQSVLKPNELYKKQLIELDSLLAKNIITEETHTRKQLEYKTALDDSMGVVDLYSEAQRILAEQMDPLDAQLQALADDQSLLNKAWLEGQLSADKFALGMSSIDQKMVDLQEGLEETTDDLSVFADQAARNMQDSFADFLFDPFEDGLSGLADNFAKTLQRMAADAAAASLFKQLGVESFLNNGLSGSGGAANLVEGEWDWLREPSGFSDIISSASSLFGGFFAEGGRPDPYKASIVGEAGPEMFIPDGISGQVVPYHELFGGGGGGEVTVNQTVQVSGTPDNRSAMQMAQETGAPCAVPNALAANSGLILWHLTNPDCWTP